MRIRAFDSFAAPRLAIGLFLGSILLAAGCTSLVGHSYFGDNNSVISDMVQLLKGLSPFNRSLVPRTLRDMKYWIFQPPVR
jgi:hypothetical protein